MRESPSDFRDTLKELIETSPEPGDHPSPDRWIAYHRGELPADEEERLQEHLARCRDCFDLAEGAAAFAQPDVEAGAGQEVETAALWRLLRPQLGPSPGSSSDNVRAISAAAPPVRERRLPPYALAASFFVALVGLAAWNLYQRSALEALRAPRPNAPIFDFSAGERVPGQELIMPAGPRMLVFHVEEPGAYRLVIRDAATDREHSSYELRPDEDLALTLYLPEGLRPGRYHLELSDGSKPQLLRVTEPDRGE